MWSGLVMFTSLDQGSTGFVEVLTVVVAIINIALIFWLLFSLGRECYRESRGGHSTSCLRLRKCIKHIYLGDVQDRSAREKVWQQQNNPAYGINVEKRQNVMFIN